MLSVNEIGKRAKTAKRELAVADDKKRSELLIKIADAVWENRQTIMENNAIDLENGRKNGLSEALLDRLTLTEDRIRGISDSARKVAGQECVTDKVIEEIERPNGLKIKKVTVPIGVIGVIFEARPNVTVDSAALCLKSGNACILRGGKEAIFSNTALTKIMRDAIKNGGMNEDCVQLIEDTSRESAVELMRLNDYVDVLIPRGGKGLIRAVCEQSTVPVIETGAGVCHVYVDKSADIKKATEIIYNAKVSRPSVCNACECMLIHKDIAKKALPIIAERLKGGNVKIMGDERVRSIVDYAEAASDEDWGKEYLTYTIAAKVVDNIDEAIEHIYNYSTGHSECIVTEDMTAADKFMSEVDSAAVYVNASTRFTDGGEFGFGAEIGISTQRLHARGPLGARELTSYKYKIYGNGQVR